MPDHQVCHAHCPPKAAAGGLGSVVAVVAGVWLLAEVGGPAAVGGALLHAVLMIVMWCGIAVGSVVGAYVGYRVVRWRRAVSHAAVPPRRAMPRYRRNAIRPAPLELTRPVSRVTAVSVRPAEAKVKR